MCAEREAAAGTEPVAWRHRFVNRDHIEPAVVGMRPRGNVVCSVVFGVHHRHDRPEPPAPAGDEMRGEPSDSAVGLDPAQIDRDADDVTGQTALVTRAADGSHHIPAK